MAVTYANYLRIDAYAAVEEVYDLFVVGGGGGDVVANAGGTYTIDEGDSLTLDATGSTASAAATFEWDVDDDGDFDEDVTGETVTLTWSELQTMGIGDGPYTGDVSVRVTDPTGGGGGLGRLYTYDYYDNVIREVDASTGAILNTFSNPIRQDIDFGLATSGTSLIVGGEIYDPILELDPNTGAVIRTIVGSSPRDISGLAFLDNEIFALTDSPGGEIRVYDFGTGGLNRVLNTRSVYEGLAASSSMLYATGSGGTTLVQINPATGAVTNSGTPPGVSTYMEGLGVIGDEIFIAQDTHVRVHDLNTLAYKRSLYGLGNELEAIGADAGGGGVGGGGGVDPVPEAEPNNSIATAQNIDAAGWNLSSDANIANSTAVPHVTIQGTGNGTFDYYSFTIANAGDTATFDIDFGYTGGTGSTDTELFLYRSSGGYSLAWNDDYSTSAGGGGSTSGLDAFVQYTFSTPGTYVIGVGEYNSYGDYGGITGNVPDSGDTYSLQVSIQNHPLGGGGGGVDIDTTTLVINNVAPTISEVTNDGPVNAGSPVTVTVSASDPAGVSDPLTYLFDFDNDGTFEVSTTSGSAEHTFTSGGIFAVPVRVTDGDGGADDASTQVTVLGGRPGIDLNGTDDDGIDFAATFIEDGGAVSIVDADLIVTAGGGEGGEGGPVSPEILLIDSDDGTTTTALTGLGIPYTLTTATGFASVDLYDYNILFVGWNIGPAKVSALEVRSAEIALWNSAGNGIVALSPYEPGEFDWAPLSNSIATAHRDDVYVVAPTHPVNQGVTSALLSNWGNSRHSYFTSWHPSFDVLTENGSENPVTVAAEYGAGRIVLSGQDPDYHYTYDSEAGAATLITNMIDWVTPTGGAGVAAEGQKIIETVSSWDGSRSIGSFGETNTATYGQTFTVDGPETDLDSFTFYVNDNVNPDYVDFEAYVMEWDGSKATGPILHQSAPISSTNNGGSDGFESFTIDTGGVSLTAGKQYVAFFCASNLFDGLYGTARFGGVLGSTYTGGSFVHDNNGSNFSQLTTSTWDNTTGGSWGDLAFEIVLSTGGGGGTGLIDSATVTITNLQDGAAESLAVDTSGTLLLAGYNPSTGVLSLTGTESAAVYEQVLRTIVYDNTSQDPNETPARTVEFLVTSGAQSSPVATSTVSVVAVNDAPSIIDLIVSDSSISENEYVTLSGSFSDPEAGDTHTVLVDWGDGQTSAATVDPSSRTFTATHQYLDDGPEPDGGSSSFVYPIQATVTDDGGLSGSDGTTVEVTNVAPTLVLDPVAAIDENGVATLSGTITDPGTLDTFTVEVDWGDPLSPDNKETFTLSLASVASVVTVEPDSFPSDTDISSAFPGVTLSASGAGVSSSVFSRTNTSHASTGAQVFGNSYTTYGLWGSGPGITFRADFDAPTDYVAIDVIPNNGYDPATLSAYNSSGVLVASFTTSGTSGSGIPEEASISRGSADIAYVTVFDPSNNYYLDNLRFNADDSGTFTLTHQYLDDDPTGTPVDEMPISVTVTDDDSGSVTSDTTVEVTNVAPTLTGLSATPILENGTTTLSGTIADVGTLDTFTVEIDWNDDGTVDETHIGLSAGPFSYSHQYLDDDPTGTPVDNMPISVSVTDDDTGSVSGDTTVEVTNVAPTLTGLSATPIFENGTTTLSGTIADVGTLDTFTVEIDWNDDGTVDETHIGLSAGSFSYSHQYLDDDPTDTPVDDMPISVTVTDDDTGTVSDGTTVEVTNVAPVIISFSSDATFDDKAAEGELVEFNASFTDVGTLDTHTAVIDWGDGSSLGPFAVTQGIGTVTATHEYAPGGVFTATLTVTDDDTGSAVKTTTAVITGAGMTDDGVLQIVGSDEGDHVAVNLQGNGLLKVHTDFFPEGNFRTFNVSEVTLIRMWLCSGDDLATVAGNIDLPAIIEGRFGNDHLNAGGGPTVLLGGPGDDMLVSGSGRDVLIGGLGADRLVGGPDEDILIGGTTDHDANDAALLEILGLWNSDDDFATRQASLAGLLNVTTVQDDDEEDVLTGTSGEDWFFEFPGDVVTDGNSSNGNGKKK